MSNPKILVYDIETTPVLAWIWRCGDQVVRHSQLHEKYNQTKIICVTYRWLHEKKSKALVFDIRRQCDKKVLKDFSKLANEADIILGKNNTKFDDKHINFRIFQHGLPPIHDLRRKSDDLERWMRSTFNMQSYALDYFSKLCTGEGKIAMYMEDWIDIVLHKDKKKLDKMVEYGLKDVDDTVALIEEVQPYVIPKHNRAAFAGDLCCTNCGSKKIKKNGTRIVGNIRKQAFYCNDHGGFAGYATIKKDGTLGVMGK